MTWIFYVLPSLTLMPYHGTDGDITYADSDYLDVDQPLVLTPVISEKGWMVQIAWLSWSKSYKIVTWRLK